MKDFSFSFSKNKKLFRFSISQQGKYGTIQSIDRINQINLRNVFSKLNFKSKIFFVFFLEKKISILLEKKKKRTFNFENLFFFDFFFSF